MKSKSKRYSSNADMWTNGVRTTWFINPGDWVDGKQVKSMERCLTPRNAEQAYVTYTDNTKSILTGYWVVE